MSVDNEKLKFEIERLVHREIVSGEILNVIVNREESFEGNPQIDVKVIYDSQSKKLNAKELAGITTMARTALLSIGEDAFPVFHYIVKSEAGKLIAAE